MIWKGKRRKHTSHVILLLLPLYVKKRSRALLLCFLYKICQHHNRSILSLGAAAVLSQLLSLGIYTSQMVEIYICRKWVSAQMNEWTGKVTYQQEIKAFWISYIHVVQMYMTQYTMLTNSEEDFFSMWITQSSYNIHVYKVIIVKFFIFCNIPLKYKI